MLILLARRVRTPREDYDHLNIVVTGDVVKEEWFSVYIKGEKVGYTSRIIEGFSHSLILRETSYLRLPIGGADQEILLQGLTNLDSSLAIQSVSFTMSTDDFDVTTTAVITSNKIKVSLTQDDTENKFELDIKEKLYPPSLIPEIISRDNFSKEKYTFPAFDPVTLQQGAYTVIVGREIDGKSFGVDEPLRKITLTFSGYSSVSYITADGRTVYEEGGAGITSFAEDKDSALKFTMDKGGSRDLLEDFAIKILGKTRIDNPREVTSLKVRLRNFEIPAFELDGLNQKIIQPDTLIITTSPVIAQPPDSSLLLPEAFIQSDDIRVKKKALEITKGITDTLEILKAINNYLYENIEKEHRATLPSASEILKSMRGDCNEHTVLFIAMARSLGIPSKAVVGVVMMDDKFYYHSWVTAYTNGHYHFFDPTFGQYPIDATHIRLVSGSLEKQIQLIRLTNPSIWILSYE